MTTKESEVDVSGRELLELAAKSAGIEIMNIVLAKKLEATDPDKWLVHCKRPMGWWLPLDDDGDALRLAVKLGIEPHKPSRSRSVGRVVQAWFPPSGNPDRAATAHVSVLVDGDAYAATRRAIVCAAAAIAKVEKE